MAEYRGIDEPPLRAPMNGPDGLVSRTWIEWFQQLGNSANNNIPGGPSIPDEGDVINLIEARALQLHYFTGAGSDAITVPEYQIDSATMVFVNNTKLRNDNDTEYSKTNSTTITPTGANVFPAGRPCVFAYTPVT